METQRKHVWTDLFLSIDRETSISSTVSRERKEEMVTKFERWFFRPQVYGKFSVKNEEFSIEDLPANQFEDAVDFMIKYYAADETFMKAFQVPEQSLREFYRFVFKQRTTIVCFKKGCSDIVGINALSVRTKGIDTSFKVNL